MNFSIKSMNDKWSTVDLANILPKTTIDSFFFIKLLKTHAFVSQNYVRIQDKITQH